MHTTYSTSTFDRLSLKRLEANLGQLRRAQEACRSGDYDADPELLAEMFGSLERDVAYAMAELVGEAGNGMSTHAHELLVDGFARQHPTLLANVLRAVLDACERHPHDGRLPEWARTGEKAVPFV
jgi:hypothetical protein